MVMKTCTKCGQTFPATTEYFSRRAESYDGLQSRCKVCQMVISRDYYKTHKEQVLIAAHSYYKVHKEREVTRIRAYQKVHRKEAAAYSRAYYKTHKEQAATNNQAWRDAHKEERAVANQVWQRQNRGRLAEHSRQRLQVNPKLRLNQALACMIRYSLRGSKAGRHWETLVGYTFLALMCHLESLFQPGMTWENYGEWQVDHIRPIASFTFTSADDPEFRQCWALSNLQPLWATDNHHKGARWTKELTA